MHIFTDWLTYAIYKAPRLLVADSLTRLDWFENGANGLLRTYGVDTLNLKQNKNMVDC
jgi:hypothetical protein